MTSEITGVKYSERRRVSDTQHRPLLLLAFRCCCYVGSVWNEDGTGLSGCPLSTAIHPSPLSPQASCRPRQGPRPPCLAAGLPPSSSHPASRMLSPPPEPGTAERSCIHGEGHVWTPAPPSVTQAPSHSRPSPGPSGQPPGQPFRERTNSRQASSALVVLTRGAGSFFVGGGGRLWASWGILTGYQ